MNNTEIVRQIDIIINKGHCFYTLEQAYSGLEKIKPFISAEEYRDIFTELSHKELGENADGLVRICKETKRKYL